MLEAILQFVGFGGLITVYVIREIRRSRPRTVNPHNPERVKGGDLPSTFLIGEFREIREGLTRIENLLRDRLPK